MKIYENPRKPSKINGFRLILSTQGGRSGGAGGAREVVVSVRGVAAGVSESSSMLGILLGVSPPLFTAIRGREVAL